jgi:hypothetical protein
MPVFEDRNNNGSRHVTLDGSRQMTPMGIEPCPIYRSRESVDAAGERLLERVRRTRVDDRGFVRLLDEGSVEQHDRIAAPSPDQVYADDEPTRKPTNLTAAMALVDAGQAEDVFA